MYKQISSFQNPTIKRLLQLQEKSRARKKEGRFVVEGAREIAMARNITAQFGDDLPGILDEYLATMDH